MPCTRSAITILVKDHLPCGLESESMKRRIFTADVVRSEEIGQIFSEMITVEVILEHWSLESETQSRSQGHLNADLDPLLQ
tara:strand:+ start:169 stop:411 length:243 start_codon:yes stop_codon:yes gene_type:complete